MKILIGQSYFRYMDSKELKRKMPYPPLGPLYIATLLKEMGHVIIFYDAMISESIYEFERAIQTENPDLLLIYDDEFNYLTKMCLSDMRNIALDFIQESKKNNIPSLVYSSDAIDHSNQYLQSGCTAVIIGEAEDTVVELVTNYNFKTNNKDFLREIKGIKFLINDSIVFTGNRDLINNLDKLPDPDYNFVNIKKYKEIWLKNHNYFSLNISTTRGCPYNCNWCSKPLYGRSYFMRSVDRVINQIQNLIQNFQVDHIWITDDIFGLKYTWLENFANKMHSTHTKIPYGFKSLSRADLLIKKNVVELLKKAGCSTVWIGAESGSQKILNSMEKGITVNQILEASRLLKHYKINVGFFIQFGYLGESWEDILLTRNLIKISMPDDVGISVSYPLPGTKFYSAVVNQLGEKKNWSDSDDLDLLYHGTYPPKFYKLLHRFVHSEYNTYKIFNKRPTLKFPLVIVYVLRYFYFRYQLNNYLAKKNQNIELNVSST